MGDGGSAGDPGNRSQNGQNLLGKMLRIDVNGPGGTYLIPPSNPFIGNSSVDDRIWSIGLRNPWKFSFDRITGDMNLSLARLITNDAAWRDLPVRISGGGLAQYTMCIRQRFEGDDPLRIVRTA